eukprot:gb/GFBE01043318.1/.p1 GENE.gb/GFBE01043318.1/~~gb/GFBE01043318.1/.p1  ORF type:complete len:365 (+),score=50.68 gb/GFBE01043318.1/:1-1095(+)
MAEPGEIGDPAANPSDTEQFSSSGAVGEESVSQQKKAKRQKNRMNAHGVKMLSEDMNVEATALAPPAAAGCGLQPTPSTAVGSEDQPFPPPRRSPMAVPASPSGPMASMGPASASPSHAAVGEFQPFGAERSPKQEQFQQFQSRNTVSFPMQPAQIPMQNGFQDPISELAAARFGEQDFQGMTTEKNKEAAAAAWDRAQAVRQKLQTHSQLHSDASTYYRRLFLCLVIPSMILAVMVPIIEGLTQSDVEWRRTTVLLVGASNACLLAIMHMSGFDSLRDRHAETAKLYTSLVHDFDYKVWYPGQKCGESMHSNLQEFLKICDKVVGALASQTPTLPGHIKEPLELSVLNPVRGSARVTPDQGMW